MSLFSHACSSATTVFWTACSFRTIMASQSSRMWFESQYYTQSANFNQTVWVFMFIFPVMLHHRIVKLYATSYCSLLCLFIQFWHSMHHISATMGLINYLNFIISIRDRSSIFFITYLYMLWTKIELIECIIQTIFQMMMLINIRLIKLFE